jgi:hypothetical protein
MTKSGGEAGGGEWVCPTQCGGIWQDEHGTCRIPHIVR